MYLHTDDDEELLLRVSVMCFNDIRGVTEFYLFIRCRPLSTLFRLLCFGFGNFPFLSSFTLSTTATVFMV